MNAQEPVASTSAAAAASTSQFPAQQQQRAIAAQQQQSNNSLGGIFHFSINPQHVADEDYFDIDSILATTASVACTFGQETPLELFPLIGQKAPESISEKGYRTVMPAWMLSADIGDICQFSVPSAYNKVNREVIAAGARSGKLEATRLVARQRHFYTFGQHICRHVQSEELRQWIAVELLDAFTQRIAPILMRAIDVNSKADELMDEAERKIFAELQEAERLHREWIRREHRAESRGAANGTGGRRGSTKRKFGGAL